MQTRLIIYNGTDRYIPYEQALRTPGLSVRGITLFKGGKRWDAFSVCLIEATDAFDDEGNLKDGVFIIHESSGKFHYYSKY